MANSPHISPPSDGALARGVQRISRAAARRPKLTIGLWLLLVAACVMAGSSVGTKSLTNSQQGVGESAHADAIIAAAHLTRPAEESILIQSPSAAGTTSAVRALEARLAAVPQVAAVHGPNDTPALSQAGGRTGLVQVTLRGDPNDADDHVGGVERAVRAVAATHPQARLQEAGDGSIGQAFNTAAGTDLGHAELLSFPITLLILVLAFGALVAASVPLLLGMTSVVAALGAEGLVSHITPVSSSASSVILLIGLAVGVDYSLFYIRREREERAAGRAPMAALEAASATVGRAIVVSGLTVVVALAGLLFTGSRVFTSIGLATIVVVAIAVLGSVTVLPAVLAKLGDRVDRGRIPFVGRRRGRRQGRPDGMWARVARLVTSRPLPALVIAACVLGTLAIPVLQMKTADPDITDLPTTTPVRVAYEAIDRAFPGAPEDSALVLRGHDLGSPRARERLAVLGQRAETITGGSGQATVAVSRDGRTAVVRVPMPDQGLDRAKQVVTELRATVARSAQALVTGDAASSLDFANRMATATPIVIGFVMGLAFLLLLAAFGSPALAATVVALNLLSVGAAYGVLVAVFQHHWAEGVLSFQSNGAIVSWLPLFAFVVLFGLSMDYTVLVLERIREARRSGLSASAAAAAGVAATGGAVTSAAIVMVFVFGVFGTLGLLEFKQLGVGLSAAVLIDATIVRGVALPAAVALLGDRRWRVRRSAPRWDHPVRVPALAHEGDGR
ncbi:MAG TPA: MMPL family transporter [Solirubrobacteraceae bacterium]|nr:MMPL family transporter [Solirubrobacteraceae bacterium]